MEEEPVGAMAHAPHAAARRHPYPVFWSPAETPVTVERMSAR